MLNEEQNWKADEVGVGISMVMMAVGAVMFVITTALSDWKEQNAQTDIDRPTGREQHKGNGGNVSYPPLHGKPKVDKGVRRVFRGRG